MENSYLILSSKRHLLVLKMDNNGNSKLSRHTFKARTFLQAVRLYLRHNFDSSCRRLLLEDTDSGDRLDCQLDYSFECDSNREDKYAAPCDWRPFP